MGTLLYHIATKLKNQITHRRDLLIKYVTSKKLASENQLNGKDNILSIDIKQTDMKVKEKTKKEMEDIIPIFCVNVFTEDVSKFFF